MWKTFKKVEFTTLPPSISVDSRGNISINKAAMIALLGHLPDTALDFELLWDRDTGRVGFRVADASDTNSLRARRPKTGRMLDDGTRKFTNTWRLTAPAFVRAVGLGKGRHGAVIDSDMIVVEG